MNSPKAGLRLAAFIFGLVCVVHIWRVIAHAPVQIGSFTVPMSASIIGAIIAGLLSLWMLRLSSISGNS